MINTQITKFGQEVPLSALTEVQLKELKDALKVNTKWTHYTTVKTIKCYRLLTKPSGEQVIAVPRFFNNGQLQVTQTKLKTYPLSSDFTQAIQLRDYQEPAATACLTQLRSKGGCILNVGCGFGKTPTSLYIASQLKERTIIFVHSRSMIAYWTESIQQFLPEATIGIIRQNTIELDRDFVIASIQTLISPRNCQLNINHFGTLIIDEVHHYAADKFSQLVLKNTFKYQLGLTATLRRSDGLIKIVNLYMGDIAYSQEDVDKFNNATTPSNSQTKAAIVHYRIFNFLSTHPLFTIPKMYYKNKQITNHSRLVTNLTQLTTRTQLIVDIVQELLTDSQRKIIVFTHRMAHVTTIKNMLLEKLRNAEGESTKVKVATYTRNLSDAERKAVTTEADVIVATNQIAGESFNVTYLNTLVMATPVGDPEQLVGRIKRKITPGLAPLIIEIADGLECLEGMRKLRTRYYKTQRFINDASHYVIDTGKDNYVQTTELEFKRLLKSDPHFRS